MNTRRLTRSAAICGYLFGLGSISYLAASHAATATFASIALIAVSLFTIYS